jgi:hypothetical protein
MPHVDFVSSTRIHVLAMVPTRNSVSLLSCNRPVEISADMLIRGLGLESVFGMTSVPLNQIYEPGK